jgi:N-acetylglucosaminyldiphosphoundecaprenol N-acetyl-beta-D-mannosaminyltransferase
MDSVVTFAGIEFRGLTRKTLFERSDRLKVITTVNAEFIVMANQDRRFWRILCDSWSTFDGQIPYLLARRLNPGLELEKISGSDLIFDVCAFARDQNQRVFLLGGLAESNRRTVEILRGRYGIEIDGFSPEFRPYPFDDAFNRALLEHVQRASPDFLLVALGAPKQEYWLDDNRDALERMGVRWAVGVGGTFDFVSGKERRAPVLVQRAGLEGIWRLAQNPTRLRRFLHIFRMFEYVVRPRWSR